MNERPDRRVDVSLRKAKRLDGPFLLSTALWTALFLFVAHKRTALSVDLVTNLRRPSGPFLAQGLPVPVIEVNELGEIYLDKEKALAEIDRIPSDDSGQSGVFFRPDEMDKFLSAMKELADKMPEMTGLQGPVNGKAVNLVMNENLAYGTVKKVMNTVSAAGFNKIKFTATADERGAVGK